jgi:hypothetical protein
LIVPPDEAITEPSCEMQDQLNCEVEPLLQCRRSVDIDGQRITLILLSDTVVSNTHTAQEDSSGMLSSQNKEGCTYNRPQETETQYIHAAMSEDIKHATGSVLEEGGGFTQERSRKRERNPLLWQVNKRTKLRQSSSEYISVRGKLIPKRKVNGHNNECRFSCAEKFSEIDG